MPSALFPCQYTGINLTIQIYFLQRDIYLIFHQLRNRLRYIQYICILFANVQAMKIDLLLSKISGVVILNINDAAPGECVRVWEAIFSTPIR